MKIGDRRGEFSLTPQAFDNHCQEARVLACRQGRPSVLVHEDGSGGRVVTKVFYPRRSWPKGWLWPHSERFRRMLRELAVRGIAVPVERAAGRVTGTDIRLVTYEWLDGVDLRALGRQLPRRELAAFVADLHALGVYCRGLHLGNVVALVEGGFGLLDVTDTRLLDRPLPLRMRARNLGILCAHPEDIAVLEHGTWSDLVMDYCRAAGLSVAAAARLRDRVRMEVVRRSIRRQRTAGLGAGPLIGVLSGRER